MNTSTPWTQGESLTVAKIRKILELNIPSLAVSKVSTLGDGWDNTTWLVNDEWVFRFPKHENAKQLLLNEIKILPNLPKLKVNHPEPGFICLKPKVFAFPFYGHRYLEGISADRAELTNDMRTNVAGELGKFLKQLHSFSIEKAKQLGVDTDRFDRSNIKKRLAVIKERLVYLTQRNLLDDEQVFIDYLERYVELPISGELVLGHGDLYAKHILLNETKRLKAIID